jgi:hydrogenase expression/formation protein HypD
MDDALNIADCLWRGIGYIPASGFALKDKYAAYDAAQKFPYRKRESPCAAHPCCIAGEIMKGKRHAADCRCFGTECTPDHPLGAPMVSAEGVCAAYYQYPQRWK